MSARFIIVGILFSVRQRNATARLHLSASFTAWITHIEFETMNYMNSKNVRFMVIIQLYVYLHHSWSVGLSPTLPMETKVSFEEGR